LAIGRSVCFWRGDVLGTQGEPCPELFILERGQVLLSLSDEAGTRAVELVAPGSIFGEGALLPEGAWTTGARALATGRARAIPAGELARLQGAHPELSLALLRLLAQRLDRMASRPHARPGLSAPERLREVLRALALQHGERRGAAVWLPLRLTQAELGNLAGLARETVARAVAELEAQGALERCGRSGVWIRDV
jgi:CRP/FNR family transcriptional regulator